MAIACDDRPRTRVEIAVLNLETVLEHHGTHLAPALSTQSHESSFVGIAYRCLSYGPEVRTFISPHDSSWYVGGQDTLAEPTNEETAFFMRSGTRSGGGIPHPEVLSQ